VLDWTTKSGASSCWKVRCGNLPLLRFEIPLRPLLTFHLVEGPYPDEREVQNDAGPLPISLRINKEEIDDCS
jgi:hypothetical protein